VFNRFGTNTEVNTEDEGHVHFIIGNRIPSTFAWSDRSVVVSPQNAVMLVSPQQFQIKRPEDSEVLVLRTSLSALFAHLEKLTARHHRGTLLFDHNIDLTNGPGAMLKRTIEYVVNEIEHNDHVIKTPSLLKGLDHLLLTTLLFLPHNKRENFFKSHKREVATDLVKCAEEYMRAHLEEAISILDLLHICNCSRSVLFSAFSTSRGYTPMEFLTEQRFHRAHEKLLKARLEESVTDIALDCGFNHFGRFPQLYRKRFGELPSETLRKSQ
jgi:AraC-like DNA-binding protein